VSEIVAVLREADRLLVEAEMSHATVVVLEEIARCWPAATGEVGDEWLVYVNLACLWSNFADWGAERPLLELILEDRSQLSQVRRAVPGSEDGRAVTCAAVRHRAASSEARNER
jgi:hypothetical protein